MVAYVGACEHGHGSQPVDSLTFGVVLNEVSRIDTVMLEQQPQLVDARAVGDQVPMAPDPVLPPVAEQDVLDIPTVTGSPYRHARRLRPFAFGGGVPQPALPLVVGFPGRRYGEGRPAGPPVRPVGPARRRYVRPAPARWQSGYVTGVEPQSPGGSVGRLQSDGEEPAPCRHVTPLQQVVNP
jgi:hypothetical protein